MRAKFRCYKVASLGPTQGPIQREEVDLYAVFEQEGENKKWAQATPAGALRLTIDNPEAFGKFREGRDYFIDITAAV